jgi:uncharacterized protein (DUF488 family)
VARNGREQAMPQAIWTIGYEGATQPELIARLKAAEVQTVADVRAVTSSRRAGFSKTVLAASLAEAGIGYVHLRGLGTPKAGRDAARKGRIAEMRAIFAEHMKGPDAQRDLAALRALAAERRVALLCYEADAACCHRRALVEMLGAAAVDLQAVTASRSR